MRTVGLVVLLLLPSMFLLRCDYDRDSDPDAGASVEEPINLANCGSIKCPKGSDCDGPGSSWSNKPRPDDAGACPPRPTKNGQPCTQVVLGRLRDTAQYINCPGYIVLNLTNWSQDLNDRFIGCAAADELGADCEPPILIASPNESIPDPSDGGPVTPIELCQLKACGCDVTVRDGGTGSVSCP